MQIHLFEWFVNYFMQIYWFLVFGRAWYTKHRIPYTMLSDLRHLNDYYFFRFLFNLFWIVFSPNYPLIRFKFTMNGGFFSCTESPLCLSFEARNIHSFCEWSQAHNNNNNNNLNNWQKLKVKVLIHWLNGGLSSILSLNY